MTSDDISGRYALPAHPQVSSIAPEGRKAPVNDSWIAATALAHSLPAATQDNDYDVMPGLTVIKL